MNKDKEIKKEINDISWNVTESDYRQDKSPSYSTLAAFQREGFKGLKRVLSGDRIDNESLRHGSLVDCLLTDRDNFSNIYEVCYFDKPTDLVKKIVDLIWSKGDKINNRLEKIDKTFLLDCINSVGYGADNWKDETKINKVIEAGKDYFKMLILTNSGKIVVHQDDVELAQKCVNLIKSHHFTSWIFNEPESPFYNPNAKVYYQQKFKITFRSINQCTCFLNWTSHFTESEKDTIKCMFDILYVDYKNKTITPVDLKTTSHDESQFIKSIQDWDYDIQATMYSYILRQVCLSDDYFKDFTVNPFLFLPINKFNLCPQLYEYSDSVFSKQINFVDYKGKLHRRWYDLLDDVRWHINNDVFNYASHVIYNNGITKVSFT